MQVIKRDGIVVPYQGEKIIMAVTKAMMECEVDEPTAFTVAEEIEEDIADCFFDEESEPVDIETIQDSIEERLMTMGYGRVAKAYILYRAEKDKLRKNKPVYKFLSSEFISKYKHKPNPFPTAMSEFTFVRTYSRFLPEFNRREMWWETVARVVEYNCSLAPNVSTQEAEELFDNIYNLRQFPSGRSLWVANTDVSKKYPMSNFNCSFTTIDSFDAFCEAFYLLLVGAGVGFRVLPEDVEKLPPVRTNIEIIDAYFQPVKKHERKEYTELTFQGNIATLTIGDSKEAWTKALEYFFKLYYDSAYRNIDTLCVIYDNIRPKGERLKTFGGYASGHESMQTMFKKISQVIESLDNKQHKARLKPINCADIANIIGENVVSGGVRRTAECILFDPKDTDMINAKSNLYHIVDGKWEVNQEIIHRQMSNNSVYYTQKPSRELLHWQIEAMRNNGEPAFINQEAASKRRPNFKGGNPCMEILLDSKGVCNLTEIVPLMFVKDGKLDEDALFRAQRLSARMGYRMTIVDFELHNWDYVNKRDRLIGCSVTGWQDFVNALNLSTDEQKRILRKLKEIAIEESESYAKELGLNPPVLHTTCKPSGTISLLPGVSSGVHWSHSEYYIRRIRINAFDPLAQAMKKMGYDWKPEVGQTKENAKTIVFEFPMKSPKGKTKYDVSAIEQLETYKMFMENYANHNVSITVTVKEHEWQMVEEWMWENWDSVVAVSFLPLVDSLYELLPYEAITEKKYTEMVLNLPKFKPSLLEEFEQGEEFEIVESECVGGSCPVK